MAVRRSGDRWVDQQTEQGAKIDRRATRADGKWETLTVPRAIWYLVTNNGKYLVPDEPQAKVASGHHRGGQK